MKTSKKFYKDFHISRIFFCSLVIVATLQLLAIQLFSTNQDQIEINQGWKFKPGDNSEWSKPEFDDSSWENIPVGANWEKAGYTDYDGYAWYRLSLNIPADFKKSLDHGFLKLSLGSIDDADITYFNGKKIGSTGQMPPQFSRAYWSQRNYRIPEELIQWDKTNVIAVRVYDGSRGGGLYKGPYYIEKPSLNDLFDMDYEIQNSNGIYSSPAALPVKLNFENFSSKDLQLTLNCSLNNDRVDEAIEYDQNVSILILKSKSKFSKTIEFFPPGAGFYKIKCTLSHDGEEIFKKSYFLGYDPENIKTPLTREKDFKGFWKKCKQDLALVDPSFKVTKSNRSTKDVNVYLVEMRSHENVRIKGWYSVPKTPGPHPAILSVPGYNSTMWPNVNRKYVATFALNPRGHGNSKDDVDPQGAEYMFLGFDPNHPEKYIYVGAYLDCMRAVDFLVSRPEIDNLKIGVEGGSQGGGLSFATAALDQRLAFCAPDIPWLGDWVGYPEAADWPHENYPKLLENFPGLTFADINKVLSYVDTMNLAEWIKCPVLMSVGLQDPICPPRNSFATFNKVRSDKEYKVYPYAAHNVWNAHSEYKNKWIANILGITEPGF